MLVIDAITVGYEDFPVLDAVSLMVKAGEVVAIVGPNGAGKSTLLKAVSGVLPLRAGSVRISGQEVFRLPEADRARYIAVVPQARSLPGAFSVYQTVLLGRTPYLGWLGRAGQTDLEHVSRALLANGQPCPVRAGDQHAIRGGAAACAPGAGVGTKYTRFIAR
ncbi:MAG: ABC transporter ATP-binding protein [Anaerolineae bacterium]|nr:ABC transporter ATP-binding protein [Anaerolineae bacterium]